MMELSDGRKSFPIGLAVLIQYRSVTDTQPPSHVAVAITLNAQASSLKIRAASKTPENQQCFCGLRLTSCII